MKETLFVPLRNKTASKLIRICLLSLYVALLIGLLTSCKSDSDSSTPSNNYTISDAVSKDDVTFTVNSVYETKGTKDYSVSDGNIYIVADITIENNTNEDIEGGAYISFVGDVDDIETPVFIYGSLIVDNVISGSVAAGETSTGAVVYTAPKDWKTFDLQYLPDWENKDEGLLIKIQK